MNFIAILENKALIAGVSGWVIAQILKIPMEYLRSRRWLWAMIFAAGGMPSSHSALMVGTTLAVGLYLGEEDLREVLGHTPLEVAGGVLLGLIVATVQWLIWP